MDQTFDTPIDALIGKWPAPSVANFARAIGVPVEHASAMKRRKSIPVKYWPKLVDDCQQRGIRGVNYDLLVSIHSPAPSTEAAA